MKYKRLFLLCIIFVFSVPVVILVFQAASLRWIWPEIIPRHYSCRSFRYLIHEGSALARNLFGSFLYSLLTVILTFLLSVAPASVIAREKFPGKILLQTVLLLPVLVPSITFAMGVHTFFIYLGLTDTFAGVVLVLTAFSYPYMLRALVEGYGAAGYRYSRAAKNLGAGKYAVLLGIELPLILPAAIAGGSIVFLVAFSEYFLVFLIGGGVVPSFSGYLFPFLLSTDRQTASLLSLVFLLVPIGLFFILDSTVLKLYRKRGMI